MLSGAGMVGPWAPPEPAQPLELFEKDPAALWHVYRERGRIFASCPIPAPHLWAAQRKNHVRVVCLTGDGLHRRAGSDVIELYGSLAEVRCGRCGAVERAAWSEQETSPAHRCGGWLRPALVWRGEEIDPGRVEAVERTVNECRLLIGVGIEGSEPASDWLRRGRRLGRQVLELDGAGLLELD